MKLLLQSLLVAATACLALADTPAECHYNDIEGTWTFQETERDGVLGLSCDKMGDVVYEKTISLMFPNKAVDEVGNEGTWTLVYDQGFEVNVAGRSYFAFSYFETTAGNTTTYCDRTFTGWARDLTIRNWSCFNGTKVSSIPSPRVRQDRSLRMLRSSPYKQDMRFVDAINRHQSNWRAVVYPQFEGLPLGTIYSIRGGQPVKTSQTTVRNHQSSVHTRLRVAMLPRAWDWRNISGVSYVRPVKNQGECGSCYAFASIGTIESQLLIHSGGSLQLDLSAEDVVGCSILSQGCDGGFPYLIAGRYGQEMGLVSEQCVPYNIDAACNRNRDNCHHYYTTAYSYVGGYFGACNEDEMMLALQAGPLAVGIEVQNDFMNYKSGVYHHTDLADAFNPLEETNHAVLLVGYGISEDQERYWIVQNSWGTQWGMDGYVFIRRGTDEIAIESMAVQAIAYP